MEMRYKERAGTCLNPTAKRLFTIMEEKRSNLSVAADYLTAKELLRCAKNIGSQICILKTHIDMVQDYTPSLSSELQKIAEQENFLLFEDRKFADIGSTVKQQYGAGIYKIASWAHITNAHILPGPGIIKGLKQVGAPLGRGLLLLAEMSSSESLATGPYTHSALRMAKEHPDFVIGFIAMRKLLNEPYYLHLTPGVSLSQDADSLGQRYKTPEEVIEVDKSDVIIVGRGVTQASNPKQEAEKYRTAGWNAYSKRISK